MKTKLVLFDLDGTLFDTRKINYSAYLKALLEYGYKIDYDFFSNCCNGKHYKEFLPAIVQSPTIIEEIHRKKKDYYSMFLSEAIVNEALFSIIEEIRDTYYIALVTTASRKNTVEILDYYKKNALFDLLITQEDVQKKKPDPEGFLTAMRWFKMQPRDTVIFEDSDVGVEAAIKSGACVYVVKGYN